MQSKAKTVEAYLAELPADRREALNAVREAIRGNLDPDIEEVMAWGMIAYSIPHRVYPAGYHCDPKQGLPYAMLASQKNHMSLTLMSVYLCGGGGDSGGGNPHAEWFRAAWAKSGKKLEMGAACIRFKQLEDLPLDVIGEAIRRVPAKVFMKQYTDVLAKQASSRARKPKPVAAKKPAATSKKPASQKAAAQATKPVAKKKAK
jgi:hypothetical protein